MASANQVQVALATWRESERRLWAADPDERARRAQEVVQAREAYLGIIADQAASVADQQTSDRDQAASDGDRQRAHTDHVEADGDQIRLDGAMAAFAAPEDRPLSADR